MGWGGDTVAAGEGLSDTSYHNRFDTSYHNRFDTSYHNRFDTSYHTTIR